MDVSPAIGIYIICPASLCCPVSYFACTSLRSTACGFTSSALAIYSTGEIRSTIFV